MEKVHMLHLQQSAKQGVLLWFTSKHAGKATVMASTQSTSPHPVRGDKERHKA